MAPFGPIWPIFWPMGHMGHYGPHGPCLARSEPAFASDQGFFQEAFEGGADAFDLFSGEGAEEGEGEGAGGDVFADGKVAWLVAELLGDVGCGARA